MPRLRDGVINRGASWSYVIRVPNPATGVTKPRWVGGFATEEQAKAARDEARVRARRGEYVSRSASTVADYLNEWVDAHAAAVKPKTLAGYRHDIDHYIVPRIGRMRLQALRPAVISKLYRELSEHGGRDGRPLSVSTVSHVHRTLRKALADAVDIDQVLAVNPAARSKRPKHASAEPSQIWTVEHLGLFLGTASSHRLFAFYRLAAYTGARRGEPLYPDTVTALTTKLINHHNKSDPPPARPLPHARLHELRHLHATTLLLAGVPVHVVAARLGHADPAVTLRVYSHVLREHAAGVGDIFA